MRRSGSCLLEMWKSMLTAEKVFKWSACMIVYSPICFHLLFCGRCKLSRFWLCMTAVFMSLTSLFTFVGNEAPLQIKILFCSLFMQWNLEFRNGLNSFLDYSWRMDKCFLCCLLYLSSCQSQYPVLSHSSLHEQILFLVLSFKNKFLTFFFSRPCYWILGQNNCQKNCANQKRHFAQLDKHRKQMWSVAHGWNQNEIATLKT